VGETDYGADYAAQRAKAPGWEAPSPETLAVQAFEAALADSGLAREDIDGLACGYINGGPSTEETAQMLGLKPRHMMEVLGLQRGVVPQVCTAIAEGKADTIAIVTAIASRSSGRVFGGDHAAGSGAPSTYYYHNPWGWTSQGAQWGLSWQHYMHAHGRKEADLGLVPVQLRANAMLTDTAVMRTPLTIDEYLASRYIVKPLRLLDMCLINDGAVSLIIQRADLARDAAKVPVSVAGWGSAVLTENKLDALVRRHLAEQFAESGRQALAMAGLDHGAIGHFEGYDASSFHLINHLEGHGFARAGRALDAWAAGEFAPNGRIPVNTAGGMLSGSYQHGWSQVVEVVRQLRHECGARQTQGLEVAMTSLGETDMVHPVLFTRGL
jgi:acetyl-CoA acetyltransferase